MTSYRQRPQAPQRRGASNKSSSRGGTLLAVVGLSTVLGCGTPAKDRYGTDTTSGTGSGAAGSGATGPGGSGASAGAMTGSSGGGGTTNVGGNTGTTSGGGPVAGAAGSFGTLDPSALLPQRIRRLANAEFDAAVQNLTGTSKAPAKKFAPDARQNGFTLNDAQRIDDVTAKQIFAAAQEIAAEVKARVTEVAPCANMAQAETCATSFIESYGKRAYRRPLGADEITALLGVYKVALDGGTYADGIELVVTALLNSAGFLYLTELGGSATPPATGTVVPMSPYEVAHSLSFIAAGKPASDALIEKALSGALDTPEGRETAFRELSASPERLVRVLLEWTGVDRINETDKDSNVYPQFAPLKGSIEAESTAFITKVLKDHDGAIEQLLGGKFSVADTALSKFYGSNARVGILNQAAFLATFAHATESSPVLRGVDVARRFGCISVPSPASLNITVVPAPPDPAKTTRERFAAHVADTECSACHRSIDPFGFAFEHYDGMGQYRSTENGRPVDSKVTIAVGRDFDGPYDDSNKLAEVLATSATVRACFARHLFRASAGRSDGSVSASEEAFIKLWQSLPAAEQGRVVETLLSFVKSPLFTQRRAL